MPGVLRDELAAHLKSFNSAPFLFVGSGMSRRYLGLDDWEGLLKRFAEPLGKPFAQIRSEANGDNTLIASKIAAEFADIWWASDDYEESRDLHEAEMVRFDSALKVEISRFMDAALAELDEDGVHADELRLLRAIEVDGIITTNYDGLMRRLFPTFRAFVGQDDVLFAETQGIGEIYEIHGSTTRPNSLVLTGEDYEDFNKRNAYLAAKLLTIFVDHPVVFLGYSMSDENIVAILQSIADGLTTQHLQKLQDRLIFIEWSPSATDPELGTAAFNFGGAVIPVRHAIVSDFAPIYEALATVQRKIPTRMLRLFKERVYELVRTTDPKGRLYVQDLTADVDVNQVDVVGAIGAISRLTTAYVGKSRSDLIDDVLADGDLIAERVLEEVIPPMRSDIHVPVYKYLRGAGLLDDDGSLSPDARVHARIATRVANRASRLLPPAGYHRKRAETVTAEDKDFTTLAANREPGEVFMSVALLPDDKIDVDALRNYIAEHRKDQFTDGHNLQASQWVKAVCLYDWLKYGRPAAKNRRSRPRPRAARTRVAKGA